MLSRWPEENRYVIAVSVNERFTLAGDGIALSPQQGGGPMSSTDPFTAAYDRDLPWLWNAVRRLGVPQSDLGDVCHDVFVVAWQKRDTYQADKPLRPWLYGIACGLIANRRARRAEVLSETAPQRVAAETPEQALDAKQTYGRILDSLAALDDEKRQIFVGHDIEGFAMPDLVAALGLPLNTGYSRLRLARQAFEKSFRRQEVNP